MDPITLKALQGAAGAAGDDKVYVEDVFSTYLYDGNSGSQSINNGIDLDGEGGMVWIKKRDGTDSHALFDTERGVQKYLKSDTADNEYTRDPGDALSAFNSDGFSFNGGFGAANNSSKTYTSWTFRKAPGFFDVVTWDGDGNNPRSIAHNLGSVPGCIMIKSTSHSGRDWVVYHRGTHPSAPESNLHVLNESYASVAQSWFANTAPTSTHFSVEASSNVNASGKSYVAYIFAHDDQQFGEDEDESIIKCGSYTEGSSRQEISLGFEPQWIMLKTSNSTMGWRIFDVMRGFAAADNTGSNSELEANTDSDEGSSTPTFKPTPTGFSAPSGFFGSGTNYIYIAIRRPMKTPRAATEVFYSLARTGNDTETSITGVGFSPDAHFTKLRTLDGGSYMNPWFDKLRGAGAAGSYLRPSEDAEEYTYLVSSLLLSFDQDGVTYGDGVYVNASSSSSGGDYINWMFKRAPGFFDVVAYVGDGTTSNNIPHNLGVKPEIVIVKNRDSNGTNWVFGAWIDDTLQVDMYLSDNVGSPIYSDGSVAPRWSTTTTFRVSGIGGVVIDNNTLNSNYIAYLFATLPGISKVGSYTGTGNDIDVDCGFTSGARFVMVKRSDSTGDWYLWDTERGIVGGDDPYLLLNSTAAEVTNTDYIDPLTTGFTITSSAPDALNASGGTYIYLAIA